MRVIDLKGSTVFDSSVIIDEQQGDVFKSFAPQDTSQVATAYIKVDGEKVGTVRLWVYGSEALMRQPDQEFRDNSYQAMFYRRWRGHCACVLHRLSLRAQLGVADQPHYEDGPGHRSTATCRLARI